MKMEDLMNMDDEERERKESMSRGYAAIGLHKPKTDCNIATALRACGCYGVSMMAISGARYSKHCADTMKRHRHMPLLQVEELREIIPYDCVPVAVDILAGAIPLHKYAHPERAFYIFGPEDGTLGKAVTDYCRDAVYIPTNACMNLAATVNVVLYDRQAKQSTETLNRSRARNEKSES